MCKEYVGSLLRAIRLIKRLDIKVKEDFGEGCHTTSSEPYYYNEAYQLIKRDAAIPVDHDGKCIIAKVISTSDNETNTKNHHMKWECCSECKVPTKLEVDAILALKEAFQKPMNEILKIPCTHMIMVVLINTILKLSVKNMIMILVHHPLVCYDNDTQCRSKLRILRAVSTHYPVLRNLLHGLYSGMKSHMYVATIDNALSAGDFHSLMEITNIEFYNLFSTNVEERYEQHTDTVAAGSMLRNPNLESHLLTTYAKLMIDLDKEIDDYPEHVCCSCECLHQRKNVTIVSLSDNLGSEVWPRLKNFITQNYPAATDQELFMCKYCKALVKKDKLPPRCVLNGLQTVPIPSELSKLDSLSTQLIQRAKSYQTIVRLGTYTAKVPIYNSLKACRSTMFFPCL